MNRSLALRFTWSWAALFVLVAGARSGAAIYHITTAAGFSSLPATLQPGDEIIIANGTYHAVDRTLMAAGTAANPVRMRAATPGGVVFSGGTRFTLQGSFMVISGLKFDGDVIAGGPKYDSGIFRFHTHSSDFILRDCAFNNFDTGSPATGAFWLQINGYRHTIEYCSFVGKTSEDPVLNIIPTEGIGSKDIPRRHLIRYCYFGERTVIGLNGFETIRIGESQYQMYDMSTIIEHSVFERAIYGDDISNYEPEVISSKSRNNIYRYNTFRENKGGLVLRHGDDNIIEGNFFFGVSGESANMGAGVRIIGLRHLIRNNYFQDIGGTGLRAAICLMKGTGEFSDSSTSNGYESPGSAKIYNNTIVNSAQPFALGAITSSSGTTAPRNVEIRNNIVQSSSDGGDVIYFNSDNGWAISQITFSGNHAFHANGQYGPILPASGFTLGTPVLLAHDDALGYSIPLSESPVRGSTTATVPATLRDIRSKLRPANGADAGAYDANATGTSFNRPLVRADVGPVFANRLVAERAPSFITQPTSATVSEFTPVTLAVTVESTASVSYQWYRDEVAVPDATSASLELGAVSMGSAASYTVAATNSAGRAISFPSTLVVSPSAPVITMHPVSRLVSAGSTVTFTVASDGVAPFTFQWFKGEIPVPGATSDTLLIPNAQTANAGDYTVRVTNSYNTAISNVATLSLAAGTLLLSDTFDDGERLTQALPNSAKWVSSSGSLSVMAGALVLPKGRHAVAFFKDPGTQAVNVGEKLSASATLRFSSVGNSSGGLRFGLFNSNGAGIPSSDGNTAYAGYDGYAATTTALFPDSNTSTSAPVVFRQKNPGVGTGSLITTTGSGIFSDVGSSDPLSQSLDVNIDYTVTLTAARHTSDTLTLTLSITGGALTNYVVSTSDTAGLITAFNCFALSSTSTNGSDFTIDNVVVEHAPLPPAAPTISTPPTSQTVAPGASASFSVVASGNAPFTYQWRKGGVAINGATSATLVFPSVEEIHTGSYDVLVTNATGTTPSSAVTLMLSQTITFISLADRWFTAAPLFLAAESSSGLSISYTVVSGSAFVTDNELTYTGTGTVTIRASQAGNTSYTAATPVERTFTVRPSFASWQLARFSPAELADPARTGPNGIYGSDGVTNLMKYALGLEPNQSATANLPEVTSDENSWKLTYTRPTTREDITYAVQISIDLTTWTATGVTLQRLAPGGETETWQGRYPKSSATNLFMRLQVTRN